MYPSCITFLRTMEGTPNLGCGWTSPLPEMVKAMIHCNLKSRRNRDVGRAEGHEIEREGKIEAKRALAAVL